MDRTGDPQRYEAYRAANAVAFHKYGARFLVRAGAVERVEGASRSRLVVMEFDDYDTALACYRSGEYQHAIALRRDASDADLVVIAGYDGPQPPVSGTIPTIGAKGYWVGHVDVTEPAGYQAYMAADMAPIGAHGGHFLVRGGTRELVEGRARSRSIVLAFPSYQAALACYRSEGYQAAAALRQGRAAFDLLICEGYDGPQP